MSDESNIEFTKSNLSIALKKEKFIYKFILQNLTIQFMQIKFVIDSEIIKLRKQLDKQTRVNLDLQLQF